MDDSSPLSLKLVIITFCFLLLLHFYKKGQSYLMCPGFLHLKHTKSLFSSHLSLSPLWKFLYKGDFFFFLEMNFLPLNFSPLINLLNFLVMRVESSSSSLSFPSSTSSFSLVKALRAMLFFFLFSPSCYFFAKVISYVINDPMSSSKGSVKPRFG